MDEPVTISESEVILLKKILKIVRDGDDAKVTSGRDGITIYREKIRKEYTQS